MDIDKKTWIIGCGDIGRRLSKLYEDTTLYGVVSSEISKRKCELLSINTEIIDLDSKYSLTSHDFSNSNIYYFAPPPSEGQKDTRLAGFLSQCSLLDKSPKRIVLISTTGVYGDSGGDWIDEETPINPQADRAIRRASAEQELQSWAIQTSCEIMILRVPGIYAEDRLPLARLEKGLPIVKADEAGYTNRIHADDLAKACKAAMECTILASGHIINACDGNPSTMTDYFNQVADYAQLPRPPQISLKEADEILSAGMVSYLKESRRIKNDKMLEILDIELAYPSLSHALTASIDK